MKALCMECGHGPWELRKEDPSDYEDGKPRCADPDCRSRNVELIDGGDDDEDDALPYVAAFEKIEEEGAGPLDLVRDEDLGLGPDEAREVVDEYNSLASDFSLMSADEMQEIRQEAYGKGKESGREEGKKMARQKFRRTIKQRERKEYDRGYTDALRQSRMKQAMAEFRSDNSAYVD